MLTPEEFYKKIELIFEKAIKDNPSESITAILNAVKEIDPDLEKEKCEDKKLKAEAYKEVAQEFYDLFQQIPFPEGELTDEKRNNLSQCEGFYNAIDFDAYGERCQNYLGALILHLTESDTKKTASALLNYLQEYIKEYFWIDNLIPKIFNYLSIGNFDIELEELIEKTKEDIDAIEGIPDKIKEQIKDNFLLYMIEENNEILTKKRLDFFVKFLKNQKLNDILESVASDIEDEIDFCFEDKNTNKKRKFDFENFTINKKVKREALWKERKRWLKLNVSESEVNKFAEVIQATREGKQLTNEELGLLEETVANEEYPDEIRQYACIAFILGGRILSEPSSCVAPIQFIMEKKNLSLFQKELLIKLIFEINKIAKDDTMTIIQSIWKRISKWPEKLKKGESHDSLCKKLQDKLEKTKIQPNLIMEVLKMIKDKTAVFLSDEIEESIIKNFVQNCKNLNLNIFKNSTNLQKKTKPLNLSNPLKKN